MSTTRLDPGETQHLSDSLVQVVPSFEIGNARLDVEFSAHVTEVDPTA